MYIRKVGKVMGYESRVYIISKCKNSEYGEVVAMIDLGKLDISDFYDLFTCPIDFRAYHDDWNTLIREDRCGDLCSYAYLHNVLEWLESYYKEQKKIYGGKYRMYKRLRPFYKLLKSFDNPQWINSSNDILVLHYGY